MEKYMQYEEIWKKTLNDSEKVEYEFSIAPKYKIAIVVAWVVIGLICMLISPGIIMLFLIAAGIHYWSLGLNAYAFTGKRVLVHSGWLSTKSTSINYDKIVEVSVDESYLNKAFTESGNLIIKTAGLGHDIILRNIQTPYEAKKTLDRLSHHATTEPVKATAPTKSAAEHVAELFDLKQKGAITEDEFKAHKAKILG